MTRKEIIAETLHRAGVAGYSHLSDLIESALDEDVCGLCGQPGADKIPHPEHWPGERLPESDLVHADCERVECMRAHACLTDEQRLTRLRIITA